MADSDATRAVIEAARERAEADMIELIDEAERMGLADWRGRANLTQLALIDAIEAHDREAKDE